MTHLTDRIAVWTATTAAGSTTASLMNAGAHVAIAPHWERVTAPMSLPSWPKS